MVTGPSAVTQHYLNYLTCVRKHCGHLKALGFNVLVAIRFKGISGYFPTYSS